MATEKYYLAVFPPGDGGFAAGKFAASVPGAKWVRRYIGCAGDLEERLMSESIARKTMLLLAVPEGMEVDGSYFGENEDAVLRELDGLRVSTFVYRVKGSDIIHASFEKEEPVEKALLSFEKLQQAYQGNLLRSILEKRPKMADAFVEKPLLFGTKGRVRGVGIVSGLGTSDGEYLLATTEIERYGGTCAYRRRP